MLASSFCSKFITKFFLYATLQWDVFIIIMSDTTKHKDTGSTSGSAIQELDFSATETQTYTSPYGQQSLKLQGSKWSRFKDSFKPAQATYELDEEGNQVMQTNGALKRDLQSRHLQMIAIGGSIGTGLLIGLGGSLATGGPASLLIAWGLVGTMVFCTVHALGELCIEYPVNGAFSAYATRFVDPSWGFAVGWNYALMWLIVLPLELVAAAMCIKYWNSEINPVAWVGIFYVAIVLINVFGVRGYGEAEVVLVSVKVMAIVGFIILGVVLVCGGGPTGEFIGNRYWKNPGAFNHGFKGVCSVFVTASYSLAGTEMVGLAAAETSNPKAILPKAVKQVFWRIIFFYLLSLTFIGLLVPYDSPELLGNSGTSASPFVIAIKSGGIKALPSIFNACILISITSVGNGAVYGCSRTLQSLAEQNLAPKYLKYIDRKGRPLGALLTSLGFGLLCFLSALSNVGEVFNWMLSVSGLATIFSWFSINLAHWRFRAAWRLRGRSLDQLHFTSLTGNVGSIYSMIFLILVLGVQFWIALIPVGSSEPNATNFFQNYLGVFVITAFYLGHKSWTKNWAVAIPLKDIDIDTGRRINNVELMKIEQESKFEVTNTNSILKKVKGMFL